jgi:hypothetical protein
MRAALGALLCADAATRLPYLHEHYGPHGALPASMVAELYAPPLSLYTLFESASWAAGLLTAQLLLGLVLILGLYPRACALLAWLLLVSLHHRAPMLINRGDEVLRLLCLFSTLLPTARSSPIYGAQLAYRLQLATLYWMSVLWKHGPAWWPELRAVHDALHLDSLATPLAIWLRSQLWLLPTLTAATLIIELVAPAILLFAPSRRRLMWATCLSMIALHIGFGACLRIGLFSWAMIAWWLPLIPLTHEAPPPDAPPKPDARSWAIAALILLIVTQNLLDRFERPMPHPVEAAMRQLGIAQRWSLFAPQPTLHDTWPHVSATHHDGSTHTLLATRDDAPIAYVFANARVERMFWHIAHPGMHALRISYTRAQCAADPAIASVTLDLLIQRTAPPGSPQPTPQRTWLITCRCDDGSCELGADL